MNQKIISKRINDPDNINIVCKKCIYQWKTKSKLRIVTCPNCGRKTKNPTVKQK